MTTIRALLVILALAMPSGALAQQTEILLPRVDEESRLAQNNTQSSGEGLAVNASGQRAADPSQNVKELNEAAQKRQDDLREASERFLLARLEDLRKANEQQYENSALLRAAESRRLDDLNAQRAEYERRLAEAESKRIDAIRAVDVNAVQNATERAVEQASVLALQLDRTAETSRSLVSTTEQSLAASQRQSFSEFSNRITALENSQSFGQGRQTVSDPALVALAEQVKALAEAQSTKTGEETGSSNTIYYIVTALGAVLTLLTIGGIVGGLALALRRPAPNGNGNGYEYEDRPVRRSTRKAAA